MVSSRLSPLAFLLASSRVLISQSVELDFRMQLTATDYGNFLANEPSPISTSTIAEKATARLVDEFNYVRSNASGQLKKFLDYMTYESQFFPQFCFIRVENSFVIFFPRSQLCLHDR